MRFHLREDTRNLEEIKATLGIVFYALMLAPKIRTIVVIERPNANLMIPSSFYFFHRGLPFCHDSLTTAQTSLLPSFVRGGGFLSL